MSLSVLTTWLKGILANYSGGEDKNTATFMAAALAVFALGSFLKARKMSKLNRPITRSTSFSSAQMLRGIFPAKSQARQPIVNAIFYFAKCPDADKMRRNVELLMWYDRMRSGVVMFDGEPQLIDLVDIPARAAEVVTTITVSGEQALQSAINSLCSQEMVYEENKALWRMHRVVNSDGRSAVVGRAHHVIGDGMAMVGLMNKLFTNDQGQSLSLDLAEKKKPIGGKGMAVDLSLIPVMLRAAAEVLWLPNTSPDTNTSFAPQHAADIKMTARRSVEFPTVRLDFIKAIKNKAGVTVNDVLLAATAGMIRRYSQARADPALGSKKKLSVRALMPIAFPRSRADMQTASKSLRNLWSLVSAPLAVNETTCLGRLKASAATTHQLKSSPNALVQLFLQDHVVSRLPNFLQRQIALDVFWRHSMVFSNVPGPSERMHYCGEAVQSIQITFPNLINQVIVISYNGGVSFNLSVDPQEHDTALLAELYLAELKDMAQELGVSAEDEEVLYKVQG